jgi:hypothetical protein
MKSYTFIVIVFISLSCKLFAQVTNPLDKNYTPPQNSIFGKNGETIKSSYEGLGERSANMVRLSITDFTRSQVRLIYERKIGKSTAATFGFGWSYGSDFIENIATSGGLMDELFGKNESGEELSSLQHFSKYKSGYSISTSFKYILRDDEPSVFFIEFGYKFVRLNYQSLNEISGVPVSNPEFSANINNFSICLGNNWINNIGKITFIQEFSYGIGLKYFTWDKYTQYSDNSGAIESYNKQTNQKCSNTYPIIVFRYQIGFGW